MSRAEIIFPAVLFATVAFLLGAGLFVYKYSWTVIGFPLGAGAFACVLCLVDIFMTLRRREPKPPASDMPLEPLSWASLAWAFAMVPFVVGLGFVFGSAAYLLAYLRAHGSSWRLSALIAAASLLLTWGLFIKVMRVPMPIPPLWWPW